MGEWLRENLAFVIQQFSDIGVNDIVDIALASILLFYAYRFIKERRAGKLAVGIVFLFFVLILASIFQLNIIRYLLQELFQVGFISLLILFQPELRSALEKIGGEPLKSIKGIGDQKDGGETQAVISEVCDAVMDMSADKTGALIVFERTTKLGDIVKTGTVLNADVSSFLLKNIFFNKAPMHDGATIIAENRIHSAGCFLPLSLNDSIIKDLGTRHRAGIGMSENSDAVVVIVSEETGTVSVALEGHLKRGYDRDTLAEELDGLLMTDNIYKKIKNRKSKK